MESCCVPREAHDPVQLDGQSVCIVHATCALTPNLGLCCSTRLADVNAVTIHVFDPIHGSDLIALFNLVL